MRNVSRTAKPKTLVRNAAKWKSALLAEIKKCKGTSKEVDEKYFNRYRKKEVKESLQTMYAEKCCYCEATITNVAFEDIEHRKPKAKNLFPHLAFEWKNLHLACPKCNNTKSNQWDKKFPILDAVKDDVDIHLDYKVSGVGLLRWPKTNRGDTTVRHAGLDRDSLPVTRMLLFGRALAAIESMNEALEEGVDKLKLRAEARALQLEAKDDYGSVVTWTMEKYLVEDLMP